MLLRLSLLLVCFALVFAKPTSKFSGGQKLMKDTSALEFYKENGLLNAFKDLKSVPQEYVKEVIDSLAAKFLEAKHMLPTLPKERLEKLNDVVVSWKNQDEHILADCSEKEIAKYIFDITVDTVLFLVEEMSPNSTNIISDFKLCANQPNPINCFLKTIFSFPKGIGDLFQLIQLGYDFVYLLPRLLHDIDSCIFHY